MIGRGITVGRLLGFPIRLDWSWFLIVLLLTWSLATGFQQLEPELTAGTRWLMGLAGALGLFASVLLHELGHAVVARREGIEMEGITLFIFGGVAEMRREPPSPGSEFRIAIAGPVVSAALCAIGYAVLPLVALIPNTASVTPVVGYLALINGILVLFNLIPAFPLDGGRVLRSGLWRWRRDLAWATRITAGLGKGFALALMVLGGLAVVSGSFVGGMWLFLIGLFLNGAASGAWRQVLVRRSLGGHAVREVMSPDPVSVPGEASIREFVDDYALRFHHRLFPLVDALGHLRGCITVRDAAMIPRERWDQVEVGEIARDCDPQDVVAVDADAMDVLDAMQRGGRSRRVVVEDGRVVGIVTLHDLVSHIGITLELEGRHAPREAA